MHHMRRLKNSPEEVRKAAGKLTGAEIAQLQNVVDSIVTAGEDSKKKSSRRRSPKFPWGQMDIPLNSKHQNRREKVKVKSSPC